MENKLKEKWYLKTSVIVIALLCIGPFALPLVWLTPRFSAKVKIIISIITIILTYFMVVALSKSLKSIDTYYKTILQM